MFTNPLSILIGMIFLNEKNFKLLFLDVGLMNAICGLSWFDLSKLDEKQLINEGAIAEQFVGQHTKIAVRFDTREPSLQKVKTVILNSKRRTDVEYKLASLPLYLVERLDVFENINDMESGL